MDFPVSCGQAILPLKVVKGENFKDSNICGTALDNTLRFYDKLPILVKKNVIDINFPAIPHIADHIPMNI